jgi:pimeloyl-ACP methyl ester carboxylesterase
MTAQPLLLPPGGRVRKVESKDGTRLHVQTFGPDDAPTIVLAHGITQAGRAFAYQVLDLADRYRVVVYDQRGHGASMVPRELHRFRVDALADDLHAVLTAVLRDGERAVLGGHSLGGITIMAWAGRHPDEVRRRAAATVLINTAPGGILDHVAVVGVPRRLHGTARVLVRRRLLFVARTGARAPLRWLALGDVAEPVHIEALAQMARRMPARSLHALAYHLTDLDLSPDLHRLAVPTTVIGGVKDRLLPAVHSRQIAGALPQLDRLVLLRGIGHMAQWEARDQVAELIDTAARSHLG